MNSPLQQQHLFHRSIVPSPNPSPLLRTRCPTARQQQQHLHPRKKRFHLRLLSVLLGGCITTLWVALYRPIITTTITMTPTTTTTTAPSLLLDGFAETLPARSSRTNSSRSEDGGVTISYYEMRWPRHKLPSWARKVIRNDNSNGNNYEPDVQSSQPQSPPQQNTSLCFVHVGKAAGSSVGCALGFQLHCDQAFVPQKQGLLLPAFTTHMMHTDINDCALHHAYYLFTLRHPIERIKSWWLYQRKPLQQLRNAPCNFTTLNDFAERGLQQPRQRRLATSRECHVLAVQVMRGECRWGNHAYHNYRWYLQQVPYNASLAVIRAEHMIDDWNSVEQRLRQDTGRGLHPDRKEEDSTMKMIRDLPSINANRRYDPSEKYVSATGIKWLCAALCDEIQVYKEILRRAVNVQPRDVQQSLDELRAECPTEVESMACPK